MNEFVRVKSICHHINFSTADRHWMIRVNVSRDLEAFVATEHVALYDFSDFSDRECAMSLYEANDLACEDGDPRKASTKLGTGQLRHNKKRPIWESTFDLDVSDLVFEVEGDEIRVDKITVRDIQYSNWCAA